MDVSGWTYSAQTFSLELIEYNELIDLSMIFNVPIICAHFQNIPLVLCLLLLFI